MYVCVCKCASTQGLHFSHATQNNFSRKSTFRHREGSGVQIYLLVVHPIPWSTPPPQPLTIPTSPTGGINNSAVAKREPGKVAAFEMSLCLDLAEGALEAKSPPLRGAPSAWRNMLSLRRATFLMGLRERPVRPFHLLALITKHQLNRRHSLELFSQLNLSCISHLWSIC